MQKIVYTEKEIAQAAAELIANAPVQTLCFHGAMGAGKTTLIKALVKALDGSDPGSSPTFGIVNEYHYRSGGVLGYHFDFYRLNDEMEALDLGFEDYLNRDTWIFIEWPEKIPSFLPQQATHVHLTTVDPLTRELRIVPSPEAAS